MNSKAGSCWLLVERGAEAGGGGSLVGFLLGVLLQKSDNGYEDGWCT
jgi:hypothetical protein